MKILVAITSNIFLLGMPSHGFVAESSTMRSTRSKHTSARTSSGDLSYLGATMYTKDNRLQALHKKSSMLSTTQMRRTSSLNMIDPGIAAGFAFQDIIPAAAFTNAPSLDHVISSSLALSVETFDGSTVDPVVVSSVFWSSFQNKILSVILGQILASIAFAGLTYALSSQFSALGDYVSKNVFQGGGGGGGGVGNENGNSSTSDARAKTVPVDVVKEKVQDAARTVKERSQAPTVAPDVPKLLLCLLIDILGTSSELLPIVGEFTDIAYAPIAALALRSLFQGSNVVFALEFAEEILPLTDILPLATICWVVETYFGDSDVARILQVGVYGPNYVEVNADTRYDAPKTNTASNADAYGGRVRTGGYNNQVSRDGVIDAQVEVLMKDDDISSNKRNVLRDGNDRLQQ